ncbi:MAG: lysylphosphatidylglycerol synthase domain-containing protein [Vicinamibacterales bacterium]
MSSVPRQAVTLIGAAVGAVLFVYAVRQVGAPDIIEGIRRMGWGFAAVLLLAGVRFLLRAMAWRLCMAPSARLGLPRALSAFLAGDAAGSITPLGLLASEPTKVFLTRHHLAPRESVASLALENLIYALSVAAMLGAGIAVALATVPLPPGWRGLGVAGLLALLAAPAVALRLLKGTWDPQRGARPSWRDRLARWRTDVVTFTTQRGASLWAVFGVDLLFHAVAVLEVYLTLRWLLGNDSPTFVQATIFETVNRFVTVAFKFVPFRIGIDEALSGAVAPLIAVDPVAGVSLAVVRKVRNLGWSAVGLAIMAVHPAEPETSATD